MSPILYSFRRCPYAMRARLALTSAQICVELREILLRDKAPEFLAISPSATVPCLQVGDLIVDESLDIMTWALSQADPEGLLDMPDVGHDIIKNFDGPFKTGLDRYKYHTRYQGAVREDERAAAAAHLWKIDARLNGQAWLFGETPRLADLAVLPFVRQFAFVDKAWFDAQSWGHVQAWLETFLASDRFGQIMTKYPKWVLGDAPESFGKPLSTAG